MSYRILVVDDSTTIQKIFKIAFSRHAATVVAAGSLIEAMSEINRFRPDLLVIDASLPGARVPEDFKRLQDDAGGVPILILAGSHESYDQHEFEKVGITHVLRKPFEGQGILRAVANVIGKEIPLSQSESMPAGSEVTQQPEAAVQIPPPPPMRAQSLTESEGDASFVGHAESSYVRESGQEHATAGENERHMLRPGLRGRPAFEDQEEPAAGRDRQGSIYGRNERGLKEADEQLNEQIRNKLEDFIGSEAPVIVRRAVEAYCEKHFDEIAKSVLRSELRRLADEKARLLVDS